MQTLSGKENVMKYNLPLCSFGMHCDCVSFQSQHSMYHGNLGVPFSEFAPYFIPIQYSSDGLPLFQTAPGQPFEKFPNCAFKGLRKIEQSCSSLGSG